MKYEIDAALSEVLRRQHQVIRKHKQLRIRNLSVLAIAVSGALLSAISSFGQIERTIPVYSSYGAFLISPQMGGYVLTGVLAFGSGVAFTLFIKHRQKK